MLYIHITEIYYSWYSTVDRKTLVNYLYLDIH